MVRPRGTIILLVLALQFTLNFCSSIENRNRHWDSNTSGADVSNPSSVSFNSSTNTIEKNDCRQSKSLSIDGAKSKTKTLANFKVTPTFTTCFNQSQSLSQNQNQGQGKRQTGNGIVVINSLNMSRFGQPLLKGVEEDELEEEDFGHWSPPEFIQRNYPYYLSGFDDYDRPIWIAEFGKFDVRTLVEKGTETMKLAEKSARQAAWRILKSIKERSTDDKPVSEAAFIIDFDGLSVRQITSLPCLSFVLRLALLYKDMILNHLGVTVVVNTNFVAEHIIRMVKPVFGPIMEKVDVYGTRKSKWQPTLRRIFGDKPIPPWYGGSNKNFTPVAVYG